MSALWPFVASASVPPAKRGVRLGRRVYPPPTIGTLLMVEAFCDLPAIFDAVEHGDFRSPALVALAGVLALPWRDTRRLVGTRRFAWRAWRARPRSLEEAAVLVALYVRAMESPPRFRPADDKPEGLFKPASSAVMRLALRVASLHGVAEDLAGTRSVLDLPAKDAIAWLLAEDELAGAHFVDYETQKRQDEIFGEG